MKVLRTLNKKNFGKFFKEIISKKIHNFAEIEKKFEKRRKKNQRKKIGKVRKIL